MSMPTTRATVPDRVERHPLAHCRALVIEDEALIAMLIEEFLGEMGCATVWTPTLAEAVEAAASGHFDVAVVDRNLGGADSRPVVEALLTRRIPVVIASGYGPAPTPDHGVVQLRKPFAAEELLQAIQKARQG
jgi:CheY-like chemotaxis protein